jgi:Flp pilus assembly protein TadD
VASAALGREVSDSGASAYFRRLATDWIRAEPAAALALFVRKLFFVFHAQHVALPHSYPFFAYETGSLLRLLPVGPWLLVPLGLAGVLVAVRDRRGSTDDERAAFLVWAAFIPGYACGIAVFFVAERYRLALLVPLCVTAGAIIEWTWRRLRQRSRRPLAVPIVALVVLATGTNWPMPFLNDGRWDEGLRLAQRLVITGDYAGAEAWVDRLERSAARPGRAHHGVGMQLVAQDQPARALTHLRQSLAKGFASADDPEIWLRLGRLSARTEGPASADPFFRRAAALAPAQASARQQHGLNLLVLHRMDEARVELREAVRLDPSDVDSLAHLAYCEIKLGDVETARRHVRAALALKPDDALARQLAGALRLEP